MAEINPDNWAQLMMGGPPVIVWENRSHSFGSPGFTYCAMYIADRDCWYLTTDARFYDLGSTCSTAQLQEILLSQRTSSWWFNTRWKRGDIIT
jgi:hypothetical protein